MALRFFNTMTRTLEEFKPITEGKVGLYTCGPTVYDFAHIGNFRTYVFEDLLRRHLIYRGYEVTHVMNITDVDDKTIRKSRTQGIALDEVTAPYIEAFFADLDSLNVLRAQHYPRATRHIDGMVKLVRKLMKLGIAYRSEDGSIYYDISKFPAYGRLAHINVDELQAGKRVAQDEYEKETASDFALWKAWDEGDGDVFWDKYKDLGKGRPGWHIECSAMSTQYLGDHFDIHTGGVDNIFPHHQNEIAQIEPCTGVTFVNYWMHSEHLQVEGTKMSKSKGNFFTLRNLLNAAENPSGKAWDPMAVRYQLLATHYRSRLDFTLRGLQTATDTRNSMLDLLRRCESQDGTEPASQDIKDMLAQAAQSFGEALDNDLNTPEALSVLFTVRNDLNKRMSAGDIGKEAAALACNFFFDCDRVLGLRLEESLHQAELSEEESRLIEARQAARKARDFAKADALRQELLERGIVLEDTPKGLKWKRV